MGIRDTKIKYNAYMRQYQTKHFRQLRKIAVVLLGGKCIICGTTKNLRFDHKNPQTKIIEVSKIMSSSKKFWTEIKKCQLLCQEHHNEKTLKERGLQNAKKIHGTISSYRYCKCQLCKKAMSDYNKKYKNKN